MSIVIALAFVLLLHYTCFLMAIRDGLKKIKRGTKSSPPEYFVSVIVPFRNESENILANYRSLAAQDYPADKFEIIYINDGSMDDSPEKLSSAIHTDNVHLLSVPQVESGSKKRAVEYGIAESRGEIIVTTDADCIHRRGWIRTLVSALDEDTGIAAGPVAFTDGNSLFAKLQKLEFAGLVLAGAGLIGAGRPTIANAANIAYRKKLFEEVGGFSDNRNISTGDDVFLLQKTARETEYDIRFCWDEEVIVETQSSPTLRDFFRQRNRWASKGILYRDPLMVVQLILIFLFFLSVPVLLALAAVIDYRAAIAAGILLLIKAAAEYAVLVMGKPLLLKNISAPVFLLAELFHIPYILFSSAAGIFGNYYWKDKKQKR